MIVVIKTQNMVEWMGNGRWLYKGKIYKATALEMVKILENDCNC